VEMLLDASPFFFAENHINTDLFFILCKPRFHPVSAATSIAAQLPDFSPSPATPTIPVSAAAQLPHRASPLPLPRSHTRRLVDHQDQVLFFERRNL
jgi:hypothetical protein